MYLLCLILLHLILFIGADINPKLESTELNNSRVTVSYTVWVSLDITEKKTINVTAPKNTSFYEVMKLAMEKDPYFSFEATESSFGHYIKTIANHTEDVAEGIFWWIYDLKEMPDPKHPPSVKQLSPVGVDGLLIDEGYYYLFWYRHMDLVEEKILK